MRTVCRTDRDAAGWVFISGEVPPRWSERAVQGSLVPLMAQEAAQLLRDPSVSPALAADDERLARLLARGKTLESIAAEFGVTRRSIDRRVRRLREQLGVGTTAELALQLARTGFG